MMTNTMTINETNFSEKIKDWVGLFRFPFYPVAILPFLLGTVLARSHGITIDWSLFFAGFLVMLLVLCSTHLVSEVYDYEVDTLSAQIGHNKFSGGGQILQKHTIHPHRVLTAASALFIIGAAIGLYILLVTKNWGLIVLGGLGTVGGIGYSLPSLRWVKRGFGEVVIAFCYGWLPVAAAYMLQTGFISHDIIYIGIPIALAILNVILINEIPDYIADKSCGKNNLCVRVGCSKSAKIYSVVSSVNALTIILLNIYVFRFNILATLGFTALIFMMLYIARQMWLGRWQDSQLLEKYCGLTIVTNLTITTLMIITLV